MHFLTLKVYTKCHHATTLFPHIVSTMRVWCKKMAPHVAMRPTGAKVETTMDETMDELAVTPGFQVAKVELSSAFHLTLTLGSNHPQGGHGSQTMFRLENNGGAIQISVDGGPL